MGLTRCVSLLLCSISMGLLHVQDLKGAYIRIAKRVYGARRNIFSVLACDWSVFGTVQCFLKFQPIMFDIYLRSD